MLALNNVVFFSWYEEGSEVPPFKSGPPSNLGPSSNSELQGPPFSPFQYHSVQKV